MLRLFGEPEANPRAFDGPRALPRSARRDAGRPTARPELDPLALSFQLKLLWLSGYLPHVTACVECGARDELVASRPGPAAPSAGATPPDRSPLAGGTRRHRAAALDAARGRPRRRPRRPRPPRRARRGHLLLRGARRLPAAQPLGMKRELGDAYELDDDPQRIDVAAVHRYISEESYWAPGRDYETQERLVRRRPGSSALPRGPPDRLLSPRRRSGSRGLPGRRLRSRGVPRPWPRRGTRSGDGRARPLCRATLAPPHDGRPRALPQARLRDTRRAADGAAGAAASFRRLRPGPGSLEAPARNRHSARVCSPFEARNPRRCGSRA